MTFPQDVAQGQHRRVVAVVLHDLHLHAGLPHGGVDGAAGIQVSAIGFSLRIGSFRWSARVTASWWTAGGSERRAIASRSGSAGHGPEPPARRQTKEIAAAREGTFVPVHQGHDHRPVAVRWKEAPDPVGRHAAGTEHQTALLRLHRQTRGLRVTGHR